MFRDYVPAEGLGVGVEAFPGCLEAIAGATHIWEGFVR